MAEDKPIELIKLKVDKMLSFSSLLIWRIK